MKNLKSAYKSFNEFVAKYNKYYLSEAEEECRFQTFLKTLQEIESTKTGSITYFADFSDEEFFAVLFGGKVIDEYVFK